MAHIELLNDLPGIRGLLAYRPATAKPLRELAEVLLVDESTLGRGERELIAAYVSHRNGCRFCCASHRAAAEAQLDEPGVVAQVLDDPFSAKIPPKLRALLAIAGKVQREGGAVGESDVQGARDAGATDLEIHDTVLIAAAFCMYNRYVDGLATWAPNDPEAYRETGLRVAREGYVNRSDLPPIAAAVEAGSPE